MTKQQMIDDGFYKVAESGGTYVTGLFFNPVTKEVRSEVLRDYDYSDGSRDNDDLYYMEINESVRVEYQHHIGIILAGDVVEVIKGRKVPIGTVATVVEIKPFKDQYGRHQADYAYLSNGMKTNVNNCKLVG